MSVPTFLVPRHSVTGGLNLADVGKGAKWLQVGRLRTYRVILMVGGNGWDPGRSGFEHC